MHVLLTVTILDLNIPIDSTLINIAFIDIFQKHEVHLKLIFRFHTKKLLINEQTELRFSCSPVTTNITQISMLAEEKDLELETVEPEFHTLSWLHKSAPCFPINGSKVRFLT